MVHDRENDSFSISLRSPINIALVKYWGKAHEDRIIPTNNSLSLTINKAELCSTTTVSIMTGTEDISLILNGKKQANVSQRIKRVVSIIQ